MMYSPMPGLKIDQPSRKCNCSEWDLYCVSTKTRFKPECRQFESVKSMIRYLPPNGTLGFARSSVKGNSREPTPPAKTIPRVRSILICEPIRPFQYGPWSTSPSSRSARAHARSAPTTEFNARPPSSAELGPGIVRTRRLPRGCQRRTPIAGGPSSAEESAHDRIRWWRTHLPARR